MKRNVKRLVSLILSVVMLLSVGSFSAFAADVPATTIPTVYVQGYGLAIYADANNSNSEKLFGGEVEFLRDGTLTKILEGFMEPLMTGISTGDYTEYNDLFVNSLVPDLSRIKLDENGEPSNGSGNTCLHDINPTNRKWYSGKYHLLEAYNFAYDWRLDPCEIADQLNDYIKKVKQVTGCEKINLVGRCLGANIVLSYLEEYGYDDVNAIQFYVAGFQGFEIAGALYSGEVVIDTDALNRFVQANLDSDDELVSFAKSLIAILNAINGLDLPIDVVYSIYDQVYTNIIPRIMKESFGTLPGFWSFVSDEYYEQAKELIFATQEDKQTYAGLIEKIDNYHYGVYQKQDEIINGALEKGINVYYIAKYGIASIPICKEAKYHGDGTVSIISQTRGASSTVMGDVFTTDYLKNAEKNGTLKYISPDKCVDASTGAAPDHTWFIKGVDHAYMAKGIDLLMARIFEENGAGDNSKYVSVFDMPEYPQYLKSSDNSDNALVYPLTDDNAHEGDEKWNVSIFEHLSNFLEKILDFILELVNKMMQLPGDIK